MTDVYVWPASAAPGEGVRCYYSTRETFDIVATRFPSRQSQTVLRNVPPEQAPEGPAQTPWQWPFVEFFVPESWASGAYLLHASTIDERRAYVPRGAALLVVRARRTRAPFVYVIPTFTYHAYNCGTSSSMEGRSLYTDARRVTLCRPGGGIGGLPWDRMNADVYDTESPRQTFAHWDAKALTWLERSGYAYECCTDLDLHLGLTRLTDYRGVIGFGHHEYWTATMRRVLDDYLAGGGNAGLFGGNTAWFQVNYDEATRSIGRCGSWNEPEWTTFGTSYAFGGGKWIGTRPATGFRISEREHWATRGIAPGTTIGGNARLIGYECDGAPEESPLRVLGVASLERWDVRDGSGDAPPNARATMGVVERGGTLFHAATVDWARVLYEGDVHVERVTHNVLRQFLTKGCG